MTPREQADGFLAALRRAAHPTASLPVCLQHAVTLMRDHFQARGCGIYLKQGDDATCTLRAYHGEEARELGSTYHGVGDLAGGPGAFPRSGILGAPIRAGGVTLGVVEVRRSPEAEFSQEDLQVLEAMGSGLGALLRDVQLSGCAVFPTCEFYEQTRQHLAEQSVLYEVGRAISSTLDLHQVLELLARLAAKALQARAAILRMTEGEAAALRLVSRFDAQGGPDVAAVDTLLAEQVRREAAPALIPDVRQEGRLADQAGSVTGPALCAPLIHQGVVIGTLGLYGKAGVGPASFTEVDLQLLVTLCAQATVAIQNARLFGAAEQRATELATLREIGQAITSQIELPAVLEAVVAGAMRLLGTQHTQIILWDEASQRLRYGAALGTEAERVRTQSLELGRGINGTVAQTRQPMILDDYQASPYALPEFADIMATITVPVIFGDRLLGVLHSHSTERGRRFTADDLRLFQMLAAQAAIAIENARLFDEARERTVRLNAMSELSRTVTSSLDLQQVFDYIVRAAVDLLGLALARVYVWQDETGLLHLRASAGVADLIPYPRETFRPGEGAVGTVFRSLQVMTLSDAGSDPRYIEQAWAREVGVRSVAVIPLLLGERAVGVLSVSRRAHRPFAADEISLLMSLAQHAAIAIENARLFHETERLAQDNLLRLREISILNEIGMAMQGTMQLDALLEVILTGVTFGGGLGFNRAILLLVDESRRVLEGRMGVGPSTGEEAARVWTALASSTRSLREVIAERAAHLREGAETAFDRLARDLVVPLRPDAGVLALTALEGRPFRVSDTRRDPRVHPQWEGRLDADEFACVPLVAKGKVVGVIAVDNKFNGKPILDEDLELLSVFATQAGLAVESARVYTHLEEASRELQRSHHQLLHQERLAALGEMAAHVVHEIRNPLVSIGGFARRLAKRLLDREPEGQYAQIIAREVDRLERIVRDVQGMSREVHPARVETDLHTLIQDCVVLFAERIAQQRVQLRMDLGSRPTVVSLDPVQVKQAMVNLLANALEAMPGSGTLTLTTRTVRRDGGEPVDWSNESTSPPLHESTGPGGPEEWVVLEVSDTGGGIPQAILDDVFNPFFTTKEAGTGLGLTLVRRIVRAHGGRVEVDNRPGEGVTFRLWLPRRPISRDEAMAA
ncbi:MAG TPA: GAF domain-containing protein [Candidatus Methylomirabilis sp.]|nr:GAF domain-containing protein [Candidatus Methylomirabilis sp.]